MIIAVDAMGGDWGPSESVPGALKALERCDAGLVLVGDEAVIRAELAKAGAASSAEQRISIVHASEQITMEDDPLEAVRHKRDSSLVVAARLVREGAASAMVSAGSTGALVAAGPLVVGRIRGIARPALATPVPTLRRPCLMLDVGANPECKPEHLLQFAVLGSAYASELFGVERPSVGLLSNGTEPTKGTEVHRRAYELLAQSGLNFKGNLEGRDIQQGDVDVIVSDGFTGNVALKLMEGLGLAMFQMIREEIGHGFATKLGAVMVKPALKKVKARLDYSEYGGAPLLGLAGLVVKAHGSSKARAFASAIAVTERLTQAGVVANMERAAQALGGSATAN
ncbi:MAG: Phosphate acyltransferase [Firmicutes bacterium ADurb.Bin506]|nr:MAG: Phosphate acyltransferase [Firmicutes bacterium ADurb.Bin506]